MISLDWNAIRTLNGSRASGFEELCAQLARTEHPTGFVRKGTPDAGMECFAVNADGSETGWQAKYFDFLGDSQWSQLDESVENAITKHPRLAQYIICVPYDRPDARIANQASAMEKWNRHVTKWTGWAAAKGLNVEFVYWGSSELLEMLHRPEHAGRVRFWFGATAFAPEWFAARFDEALKTAGPRYTPELHIDLAITKEFDAFGRTPRFFDAIKSLAKDIRKNIRELDLAKLDLATEGAAKAHDLGQTVNALLAAFGALTATPTGQLPFPEMDSLIQRITTLSDELDVFLEARMKEFDEARSVQSASPSPPYSHSSPPNPVRERQAKLWSLVRTLRGTRNQLLHASQLSEADLLILQGDAGTGKTHLLCDLTAARLRTNTPTVILMGQRFLTNDEPWDQARKQLDLADVTAAEFVGALEAAAQAANSRALVIIDAINEGNGRAIWPHHLDAFLTHIRRSPWIAVVLSVRTTYEGIILTDTVRNSGTSITHFGFGDQEYNAMKKFFAYFELELPSTPLLDPEFSNPLFLKTLCVGLHQTGNRRLPRGFHGVTAVFNLYLDAVQKTLSARLGFNPKAPLVRSALDLLADEFVQTGERWMEITRAEALINSLLPGRTYEHSLYRSLLDEGILVEDARWHEGGQATEDTYVGYERFVDHLVAKRLLDTHLAISDPSSAFSPEGGLSFLSERATFPSGGLLEALCVQLPERTGQELTTVAPELVRHWRIGDAFRKSVIWRHPSAFGEDFKGCLNSLIQTEEDWDDSLDMFLTIATIPDHPYNARFLDHYLRSEAMPERDALWSVYLHRRWGTQGAIRRIIDWASLSANSVHLDDEVLELCGITLSWMFSTANRFVRDNATVALASLLTDRLATMITLIERFADLDDPYVAERVFAAAYGVAMRSTNTAEIRTLAERIFAAVFASGQPPAHILLRDYARGVCERALFLGVGGTITAELIRPPYHSIWPTIPSDDEISLLKTTWPITSYDSGAAGWAGHRIIWSVQDDDFARYVIGTNGGLTDWTNITFDEPQWQSADDLLAALVDSFSEEEKSAWEAYQAYDSNPLSHLSAAQLQGLIRYGGEDGDDTPNTGEVSISEAETRALITSLNRRDSRKRSALKKSLTPEHFAALVQLSAQRDEATERRAPRFDLRIIQRYILWRVFDLGWTVERFGAFDREIGYHGRESHKAERIGKKYQWIAYHEIMAYIADRFRYHEAYMDADEDKVYSGPWQQSIRDIDPSCSLSHTPGGTSWEGHEHSWWAAVSHDDWGKTEDADTWATSVADLPTLDTMLITTRPSDNSRWVNLSSYLSWQEAPPPDQESSEVERRELWYLCSAYLVQSSDAPAFMEWARTVDFWNRWMPDAPEVYRMFLGEHAWSPASDYFNRPYYGSDGWTQPDNNCPVCVKVTSIEYHREGSGLDCSVDEGFALRLLDKLLLEGMHLRWSGYNAHFVDATGALAAFDPTADAVGPSGLLVREDIFREFLDREGLTVCWTFTGEKRTIAAGYGEARHKALRITGAYQLGDVRLTGFVTTTVEE